MKKRIAVSGGFDPVHIGHLRMMQDAGKHGDVVVVLNSDSWLMRKKGYIFMPFEERAEIIRGFSCVKEVVSVDDSDGTVAECLGRININYFANGGDRKQYNTPEGAVCQKLGIEMMWNIGGNKIQSSSELVEASKAAKERIRK